MAKGKKDAEVVAAGVVRDAGAENPLLDNPTEKSPRVDGKWIKVTAEELAMYEHDGKLKGYDPASGEALLK